MLRELMSYDTLRINGVEYKNLPALDWMFDDDQAQPVPEGPRGLSTAI